MLWLGTSTTLFWPRVPLKYEGENNSGEPLFGQYMFDGKFQKLTSTLAAMATAYFVSELPKRIPEKGGCLPTFDARVWNLYDVKDVEKMFRWRMEDCTKNSVSMLAQTYFSHKELQGVNTENKKKLLLEKGYDWNDQPNSFKYGTCLVKETVDVILTDEERQKIPEKFRPNENAVVKRTKNCFG